MMRAIDTSLLYAFFNTADEHHAAAVAAFQDPEPLGVPTSILQETLDLVRYRQGKKAAVAAADYLLSLPHLRLLAPAKTEAVDEVWRRHEPLSHADAGAIVTAWREDAQLLTTDAKQRAAFKRGPR